MGVNVREGFVFVCAYTSVFSNISKSINLDVSSFSSPQIKLLNLA